MPWYYAGPDAKPIGPVSVEELQAARWSGAVTPETYVIEHTGEPGSPGAWRHYREVFPGTAAHLPPLPPIPSVVVHPPPPPLVSIPPPTHPLFPSASYAPAQPPVFPSPPGPHSSYPVRRGNSYCVCGFWLGLAGLILSPACGSGLFLAVPSLIICIIGFFQVQSRPDESGRGFAIAGAILSSLTILIVVGFLFYLGSVTIKQHQVMEQSSFDSQ